jgi:predicted ribosome quality control (RQC) complex YloA/Tae2 family protein
MDLLYLKKCLRELKDNLLKKRIQKAFVGRKSASLNFGKLWLNFIFSVPNAVFFDEKFAVKERRLKLLEGWYVKDIKMPVEDRVFSFELVKVLITGEVVSLNLIVELTGKNANLILVENERIKFLLRTPKSRVRKLKQGEVYRFPPPLPSKFSPLNRKEIEKIGEEAFLKLHEESTSAVVYFSNGKPVYLTTFPYSSLEGLEKKVFSGKTPFLDAWKEFFFGFDLSEVPDKKSESCKKEEKFSDVMTFTLPEGGKLLVGKNSKGNERILKLAKDEDIWFHVKEERGAHVLLKPGEKLERDFELAVSAAVYFSKAKFSKKAEVDYTFAKFLRKVPGTPAGYVIYSEHKTAVGNSEVFESWLKETNP